MRRIDAARRRAFTVIELLIIVGVIFVMAAILLPWLQQQRLRRGSRINCCNNLKQVGLAFKTWALDNSDHLPMHVSVTNGGTMELVEAGNVWPHFQVMSNELSTPKVLFCPEEPDKQRTVASTFLPYRPAPGAAYDPVPLTNDNQISYFVGVNADDNFPQMVLAGDHSLSIGGKSAAHGLHSIWTNIPVAWLKPTHQGMGMGNVLLADGSVQLLSNLNWPSILVQAGVATNRLAIP